MLVQLHANMVDQSTRKVAHALRPTLDALGETLSADYGGIMEHLWIDLELIEAHAKSDGSPRHSFRFQNRVSGRSHFGIPSVPASLHVGHFSVRPDFDLVRSLPIDQAVVYCLSLIYRGTHILCTKSKRLGGFDAKEFRLRFHDACRRMGFQFEA